MENGEKLFGKLGGWVEGDNSSVFWSGVRPTELETNKQTKKQHLDPSSASKMWVKEEQFPKDCKCVTEGPRM